MKIKQKFKNLKKLISLTLATVISVSTLVAPITAIALEDTGAITEEAGVGGSTGAAARQTNMLAFFRSNNAGTLSESFEPTGTELRAMGVLASNNFGVGMTQGQIGSRVAEIFTTLNKSGVGGIDQKLSAGVTELSNKTMAKGLLTYNSGGSYQTATGTNVLEVIGGKVGDGKLYFDEGDGQNRVTVDFTNPAFKAAFKVAYSVNPEMFFSNQGLASMQQLRVDTFGNIWGSPNASSAPVQPQPTEGEQPTQPGVEEVRTTESTTAEDYSSWQLVLPAAINPSAYVNASNNQGFKFPLNNSFVRNMLVSSSNISTKGPSANGLIDVTRTLVGDSSTKGAIYGVTSDYNLATMTDFNSLSKTTPKDYVAITSNYPIYGSQLLNDVNTIKNAVLGMNKQEKDTLGMVMNFFASDVLIDKDNTKSINFYYTGNIANQVNFDTIAADSTYGQINIQGLSVFNTDRKVQVNNNFRLNSNSIIAFNTRGVLDVWSGSAGLASFNSIPFGTVNSMTSGGVNYNGTDVKVGIIDIFATQNFQVSDFRKFRTIDNGNEVISGGNTQTATDMLTNFSLFGSDLTPNANSNELDLQSQYLSYILDISGRIDANGMATVVEFTPENLPSMSERDYQDAQDAMENPGNIDDDEDLGLKEIADAQKRILPRILDLLSDVSGNIFRMRWVKATLDDFVLSIHRGITGTFGNTGNITHTGSTYASNLGMVYTPSLSETPVLGTILENFTNYYIVVMALTIATMVIMVFTNIRTPKEAIAAVLIMGIAIAIPNKLTDGIILGTNRAGDRIFSERFDYWAITRLNDYSVENRDIIINPGDVYNRLAREGENAYSDYGVRLKWMAPKKRQVARELFDRTRVTNDFILNMRLFRFLFSSFLYQEEYSDDPLARYLYRPLNNIAFEAAESYQKAEQLGVNTQLSSLGRSLDQTKQSITGVANTKYEKSFIAEDFYNRLYNAGGGGQLANSSTNIVIGPQKQADLKYVGMYTQNQRAYTVPYWGTNAQSVNKILTDQGLYRDIILSETIKPLSLTLQVLENVSEDSQNIEPNEDWYMKMTESPFYYFYATYKTAYGDGETVEFNRALLDPNTFRVTKFQSQNGDKVQGQLTEEMYDTNIIGSFRDYMNLQGLFTVTVPYYQMVNTFVEDYTNKYGMDISEFDFENGEIGNELLASEFSSQKTQKENMEKIWTIYNPWVDQLTYADYNQYTNIEGPNNIKRLENAINPSSYMKLETQDSRLMAFSEADMIAKGYSQRELSDVERRIQRIQENTYRDLMRLVNYYDMESETLVVTAAMYTTFNFNREFSQSNITGATTELYPLGFELRTFNFDAYMRMLLMNSTGETESGTRGIYENVLEKTSVVTGLLLLLVDVLGVVIIPVLKLIGNIFLFTLSLLLVISVILERIPQLISKVVKTLLIPAGKYFVLNLAFIFGVSLLVGEGVNTYVQTSQISVNTGDPTTALMLMALICGVYTYLMIKILGELLTNIKNSAKTVTEIVTNTVSGIGHTAKSTAAKVGAGVGGAIGAGYVMSKFGAKMGAKGGKKIKTTADDYRNRRKNGNGDTTDQQTPNNGGTGQPQGTSGTIDTPLPNTDLSSGVKDTRTREEQQAEVDRETKQLNELSQNLRDHKAEKEMAESSLSSSSSVSGTVVSVADSGPVSEKEQLHVTSEPEVVEELDTKQTKAKSSIDKFDKARQEKE